VGSPLASPTRGGGGWGRPGRGTWGSAPYETRLRHLSQQGRGEMRLTCTNQDIQAFSKKTQVLPRPGQRRAAAAVSGECPKFWVRALSKFSAESPFRSRRFGLPAAMMRFGLHLGRCLGRRTSGGHRVTGNLTGQVGVGYHVSRSLCSCLGF